MATIITILEATAHAQRIERATVAAGGLEANGNSGPGNASRDGRYVIFGSRATNLVPGDMNGWMDVFVRDRVTDQTTRVSISSSGIEGDHDSYATAVSADGRFACFTSYASNLVPGDTNGRSDVFVHDLASGITTCVSVGSNGAQGIGDSWGDDMSQDGRYVLFDSSSPNLVPNDKNGVQDVFLHDRQTARTSRVSIDSSGVEGDDGSAWGSLSDDGRFATFTSWATNLVAGDANRATDAFVHDTVTHRTIVASTDSNGVQGNGNSFPRSISADGRFVAFASEASNLVQSDANLETDVFVHDLFTGATEIASVSSEGLQGNDRSYYPAMSADGRYVVFHSFAKNLVPDDTNRAIDVFLHDRLTGETVRASVDWMGQENIDDSSYPSISRDGQTVVFSTGGQLVPDDTTAMDDVYVYDRLRVALNGAPRPHSPVNFTVTHASPRFSGHLALILLSCSGTDPLPLPGGAVVYLTFDPCTYLALELHELLMGIIDGAGTAQTPLFSLPDVAPGTMIFAGAVAVDPVSGTVDSTSAPIWFLTQ
ncbi:MAG: calcium-binding protein [Planctomycetota bacterium]